MVRNEVMGGSSNGSDARNGESNTYAAAASGRRLECGREHWPQERSREAMLMLARYLHERLPLKLSALLSLAAIAVAALLFLGEDEAAKLLKRDAALVPGDRLLGGEYITSCTSIVASGCEPRYLELGRDGSLGVYSGRRPGHATSPGIALWSPPPSHKLKGAGSYELLYSAGEVMLMTGAQVVWSSPVKDLPRDLRPWPFAP